MSDIADELRRVAKWLEPDIDLVEPYLLVRAADEIEQLREDLESARAQVTIAKQSNGFQLLADAEIERLRRTLRDLEFYENDPWARNKIRVALGMSGVWR